MAAKKQLELTPTPLEDPADKTGVDEIGRRIELKTVGGGDHKNFSHETGVVRLEQDGIEEYRKREEAEQQERMNRAKIEAHRKRASAEDLRKITDSYDPPRDKISSFADTAYLVWIGASLVFGILSMTMGSFATMLGLAAVFAVGWAAAQYVEANKVSFKVVKIVARLLYGSLLVYLGIRGILQLVDLYKNPPPQGVNWKGFGSGVVTVVMIVASIVFMGFVWRAVRAALRVHGELRAALRDPAHPLPQKYPMLENPANVVNAIYALECLIIVFVEIALTMVLASIMAPALGRAGLLNLALLLPYTTAVFLYAYPPFVHLFFRKVFFPVD